MPAQHYRIVPFLDLLLHPVTGVIRLSHLLFRKNSKIYVTIEVLKFLLFLWVYHYMSQPYRKPIFVSLETIRSQPLFVSYFVLRFPLSIQDSSTLQSDKPIFYMYLQ